MLLCFIELLLFTKYRNFFAEFMSPVLIFLIGLAIGIIPLSFSNKQDRQLPISTSTNKPWQITVFIGVIVLGFFSINTLCRQVIKSYPIDPKISDIIPLLQVMVHRAENFWYPYRTFSDFGYELFPTYLPLQWAPFIIADKLHFDYRYLASAILFLSLTFLFVKIIKADSLSFLEKLSLIILPLFGVYAFIYYDKIVIGVSIEQMIMGYYIILATVLVTQKNIYLRSGAVVLCLLSRFSLLFWVPLFLYSVYIFEGRKKLKQSFLFLFLSVLLIYVLPFILKDPYVFLKSQKAYTLAALGEWGRIPSPHLSNGLGLANYFLNFIKGDNLVKLRVLQFTMFGLSTVSIFILAIYLNRKKEKLNSQIFNVSSLKILLTIFYGFIQVPYSYLYLVPLGLSFVVLYAVSKMNIE